MSTRPASGEIQFSKTKTVLYSLLLAGAAFALIEGGARLSEPRLREIPRILVRSIDTDIELPFMEADSEVFWKPKPGFSQPMWDGRVTIGDDGLRRNPAAPPSDRGSTRFLCFGDSITFGYGVSDEHSYPAELDSLLRPRGVVVENAGVTGYTSYQTYRWLKRQLAAKRPDHVSLLIGWNDSTRRPITDAEFGTRLHSAEAADETLRRLAIYRLMKSLWLRRGLRGEEAAARPTPRVPVAEYIQNLEAFVQAARESGAKPHFIALPSRLTPGQTSGKTDYAKALAATSAKLGVPLHDVGILASDHPDIATTGNASYFLDSLHMTPTGNRLMAELLARQIEPLLR